VGRTGEAARLYEYCQQDVRVERELHSGSCRCPRSERRVWLLDYKINQRGVQLDMDGARRDHDGRDGEGKMRPRCKAASPAARRRRVTAARRHQDVDGDARRAAKPRKQAVVDS
jgi:hypothetical protein